MPETSEPMNVAAGELIDRLCDSFEAGWLERRPEPLEDVVRAAPDAVRAPLFRELLAVEREYRTRDRRPVSETEALDRFATLGPWAEGVVRDLFGARDNWAAAPPSGPDPFSELLTTRHMVLPERVGGYRVVRELGDGGMGVVYLVDDPLGHRQLAVKVMRPDRATDPVSRKRFLSEARSASAVEHENVVPIYQVGLDGDAPYLVMPFLRGETLECRLRRDPLPPLALVLKIGREIALGLAAAHEKGLVHRDAKPANVWLEGDPASPDLARQVIRAKVLDFGLARAADGTERVSITGTIVGTPGYMAPEQADGRPVDSRADVFSLGAILYRMATGRPAFTGSTVTAVLTAVATHDPPPPIRVNPALSPALSSLIVRLLEKDPEKRLASAREVADALTAIETEPAPTLRWGRHQRWAVLGGVLLAICAVAVTMRSLFGGARPVETAPSVVTTSLVPSPEAQTVTPSVRKEPLRVKSLDVEHHSNTPEGNLSRGVLGQNSFAPLLGDRVQVRAKLSRPGYAYIIAFRPDGFADLCFPNDEDTMPPLSDTPRYPLVDDKIAYGLREGTGLWVFAVVASEKPLPTYRQWLAGRAPDWKRDTCPPGTVWWYDGAELEMLRVDGGIKRGKDETLTGPAVTVRSLGRWLGQTPDVAIGVLGFGVRPRN